MELYILSVQKLEVGVVEVTNECSSIDSIYVVLVHGTETEKISDLFASDTLYLVCSSLIQQNTVHCTIITLLTITVITMYTLYHVCLV